MSWGWGWEYLPSEEYVTKGAPQVFLTAVGERAEALVRAAEAPYPDGTTYEGPGEPMRCLDVAGGSFAYVVPRLELVVVCQVTPPIG